MRAFAIALLFAACAPSITELPSPSSPSGRRSRFHRFRVTVSAATPEIRHGLSLNEIAKLPGAARGLKTQGLTIIKHSMATHTRFSTTKGAASVYAWFDDVILEVSVSSTIIHIPKEYAPDSCEYEAVLAHERLHGKSARAQAALLAEKLEATLSTSEGLPTRFDPVFASNFDAAAEKLKAEIAKVVDPVYERYEKDEAETQAALDRPDPYDAVYKKCSGWIK
ncbi:MAG: hypothetical protein HY923_11495 [Elusimicrobia bacterium]|nr:hypothetical protein [Elusimicrobiota bacterium]